MVVGLWVVSIAVALLIADHKKLRAGLYFFLALIFGPLAVLIALVSPSQNIMHGGRLKDAKRELGDLKSSVSDMQERINRLEQLVTRLSGEETIAPSAPAIRQETPKSFDMELNFGRNWLNKIGLIVFTLGMGFLISYSFKYFGPVVKIAFGYLVGLILFFFGFKLENKEKYVNFGRVLLGGGWALVYFTTYAMHHFEASRLIPSEMIDLFLLAAVVAGMITHVLRYKNEEMMSIALLVAYLTATFGQITGFTVISCLLLAAIILFLSYSFRWVKTLILGVLMTYAIHFFWILPNIHTSATQPMLLGMATHDYRSLMNFIFLTAYWVVFLAGAHLSRTPDDARTEKTLAAANFGNMALYMALAYPVILNLFYDHRFTFVFGIGLVYLALALVMKKTGRAKVFVSDIVVGIFAVTFAIPLRFSPTSTLLLWLIEAPFLVFIGAHFKEKIYRYLGYILAILIALRLLFLNFLEGMVVVRVFGTYLSWQDYMSFWAGVSMALCFILLWLAKDDPDRSDGDAFFSQFFSASACVYFTYLVYLLVDQPWIAFGYAIEGLLLLAVGAFFVLKRFRIYAYLILAMSAMSFMTEHVVTSSIFLKRFIICADVALIFAAYFAGKVLNRIRRAELFFEQEEGIIFWIGIVLMTFAIFRHAHAPWISLSLGTAALLVVLTGILDGNKTERMGGLLLLVFTLCRVIFVDFSGLAVIFKIITFTALGALCVGISFAYNRYTASMVTEKGRAS